MPSHGPQTVSVVVEWENVQLAEAARARRMLARLASNARDAVERQIVQAAVELVVCFDPTEIDGDELRRDLGRELQGSEDVLRHGVLAVENAEYYELKNEGARHAQGDVLVFLDSDVIPEDGWLIGLLTPFADATVGVVAGNSYIEPEGVYGKTFALGWFFPLRAADARIAPARKFFANNVAFRRSVFDAFRFPTLDGASRGSCWRLAQILRSEDVGMVSSSAAQVSHPAPNGARHFVARGIAQGRDRVFQERAWGSRRSASVLGTAERFKRDFRRATTSIRTHHAAVALPERQVPLALALACSYYVLCALGELGTMLNPRSMARHARI